MAAGSPPRHLGLLFVAPSSAGHSFASLSDLVGSSGGSDTLVSAASTALEALKDILDAADTLPCIKYIAGVGVKILEIIDVREPAP